MKLRIGLGVAQLSSSSGGIQMNTIAHAQLRSGAADLHVGGTLLSMAEVSFNTRYQCSYLLGFCHLVFSESCGGALD